MILYRKEDYKLAAKTDVPTLLRKEGARFMHDNDFLKSPSVVIMHPVVFYSFLDQVGPLLCCQLRGEDKIEYCGVRIVRSDDAGLEIW